MSLSGQVCQHRSRCLGLIQPFIRYKWHVFYFLFFLFFFKKTKQNNVLLNEVNNALHVIYQLIIQLLQQRLKNHKKL